MHIALTIAGSDSGGGAGIQADLKTFHQFGVFGTSAIVALTAQNTRGVRAVYPVPGDMVRQQLDAIAEDLPPDAVKTGMLATTALVNLAAEAIRVHKWKQYVLDPVMVASSGDRLLDVDAEHAIRAVLLPLAALITPNLDEAGILAGFPVRDEAGMIRAGLALLDAGAGAALIKGGHGEGPEVVNLLVTREGVERFAKPRLESTSTHGTGCTLSAAVTAGLALGNDLASSVRAAVDFVHRAIESAPGLGGGHGPLNHLTPVTPSP